jgi:hypothetical protein
VFIRGPQATADEPEAQPADVDGLAVEQRDAVAQVLGVEMRQVDVAVGEVGGGRERREQLRVLTADRRLHDGGAVALEAGPEPARPFPGLVEPHLGAQLNPPADGVGAEQAAHDPAAVVVVVDEQDQVAQADKRVGARRGGRERVRPSVHVAHHMDPHVRSLEPGGPQTDARRTGYTSSY